MEYADMLDELKQTLTQLNEAYEEAVKEIEKDFPGANAFHIRSADGRFILLDALTAMVNAQATLAFPEKLPYLGGVECEKGRVSSSAD